MAIHGSPRELTVTERGNDDGNVSDIPWASVFDPALNIRALGEIQARGFRAATEIVNRFVRMTGTNSVADRTDGEQAPSPEPAADPRGDRATPPPDVDQVLQLWQRLAAQTLESLRVWWKSSWNPAVYFRDSSPRLIEFSLDSIALKSGVPVFPPFSEGTAWNVTNLSSIELDWNEEEEKP